MRHTIGLFLALAAFWLLNSGHISVFILSLGLVSIVFVLCIIRRMNKIDQEVQPLLITSKLLGYFIWLVKEIILANITVVRHIWLGNGNISPTMRTIRASQKTDLGRVIYASSITLTPGTVAVDIVGDRILVHALLQENIDALEAGDMDRKVSQLEDKC